MADQPVDKEAGALVEPAQDVIEQAQEKAQEVVEQAQDVARATTDHPAVQAMARTGYAANGLIHLLIAWAALGIAWTPFGKGDADQSGAVQLIAERSWGGALLWVLMAGFVGLALWQLAEGVGGWHGHGKDALFGRLKALGKAGVYVALASTCFTFARGGRSDGSDQSMDMTRTLLDAPMGRVLVAVLGLVIVGIGGYHVAKGWRASFRKDLVEDPGAVAMNAGRYGYIAKGIALVVVGLLFEAAAIQGGAGPAKGLDGALRSLSETPYGTGLLTFVAVGFAAYGVYSFFRARYTKV